MSKLLKFGAGLAAGAVVGAVALRMYQKAEDNLRVELVAAVRAAYSDAEIDVVWIFDEPVRPGVFTGGLNIADKTVSFEIEEESMQVYELTNDADAEQTLKGAVE